jgi:hypothetical protein
MENGSYLVDPASSHMLVSNVGTTNNRVCNSYVQGSDTDGKPKLSLKWAASGLLCLQRRQIAWTSRLHPSSTVAHGKLWSDTGGKLTGMVKICKVGTMGSQVLRACT